MPGLVVLSEQQAGDQKTGEHEEDVDADEPATPAEEVVDDDDRDSEGAEPLDVAPGRWSGRRVDTEDLA